MTQGSSLVIPWSTRGVCLSVSLQLALMEPSGLMWKPYRQSVTSCRLRIPLSIRTRTRVGWPTKVPSQTTSGKNRIVYSNRQQTTCWTECVVINVNMVLSLQTFLVKAKHDRRKNDILHLEAMQHFHRILRIHDGEFCEVYADMTMCGPSGQDGPKDHLE